MDEPAAPLPPRTSEQLLIDALPQFPAGRLLANTAGRGQFALAYAARHPTADVLCWTLDLYQQQQLQRAWGSATTARSVCQADLPEETVDLVALALSKQGDGELTRDLLQQGYQRLREGGWLWAATDNPDDRWLGERIAQLAGQVERQPSAEGVLYRAQRRQALKKIKNYEADLAFRDEGRLLRLRTRPGVFSHREVDPGARALLRGMEIPPGGQVLDIGCGSGVVALAAAARQPTAKVHAIDANARAVDCTRAGAVLNDLENITVALDCDGASVATGKFDLAVANPPYFSQFRLAELFIRMAAAALRPDGALLLVTKTPEWYDEHLVELGFRPPHFEPSGRYILVRAVRSPGPPR